MNTGHLTAFAWSIAILLLACSGSDTTGFGSEPDPPAGEACDRERTDAVSACSPSYTECATACADDACRSNCAYLLCACQEQAYGDAYVCTQQAADTERSTLNGCIHDYFVAACACEAQCTALDCNSACRPIDDPAYNACFA